VLAFLDSLCSALIARDSDRIHVLLEHPLAHALPRAVREEAIAIARGQRRAFVAPLQSLRLYHQTAHLLGAGADPATRRQMSQDAETELRQMELPLERVTVQ
jgi:hypothetical protein